MTSDFRKISAVRSLAGGTTWYLSGDCLLAAKRMMYVVEYRRFYLRDLESIVVWPNRLWRWRVIIPAVLLAVVSASLGVWVNSTASEIFAVMAVGWVALELALGPTAKSRIRITGASLELPLVGRTRRAREILEKIDEAVQPTRGSVEHSIAATTVAERPVSVVPTNSEASAVQSIAATTQTNGS